MAWKQTCNFFRPFSYSWNPSFTYIRRNLSYSITSSLTRAEGIVSPVLCGRGDKKTEKGKRFKGSFGNARPKKDKRIARIKEKVEIPSSTPWPLPFKLV